jgi:hypothetical protein
VWRRTTVARGCPKSLEPTGNFICLLFTLYALYMFTPTLYAFSQPLYHVCADFAQKCPNILWNMKIRYRFHKSPPLIPILSQINLVHTIPPHPISLRSILILSSHLHLVLPSGLFPSGFPTKILYAFLFSSHSCYMSPHLIVLDLKFLITLGEAYKVWSSSICSFLEPPITSPSSVFDHKILFI